VASTPSSAGWGCPSWRIHGGQIRPEDGRDGGAGHLAGAVPRLTPVALSALIITGHMSMKMFDLIMSVSGAQWITEVPAVYVWQTLLTSDFAKSAAISVFCSSWSRSSSCPT
jgi:hypothetical protein